MAGKGLSGMLSMIMCMLVLTMLTAASSHAQSTVLYYPHVASDESWETEVCIIHTGSDENVTGVFRAYDGTGTGVGNFQVALAAHGRREFIVADEFDFPASIRYIVFETSADTGNMVGYVKFFTRSGGRRAAVPAVRVINTGDIMVPHIDTTGGWWTGIGLVNTTSDTKNLSIEFNTGDEKTIVMAPNAHRAFTIKSLFPGESTEGIDSAVITNGDGVIGLELFGNSQAGDANQLAGLLLKDEVTVNVTWPHIPDDDTWWTGIAVFNPFDESAVLTMTPYQAGGMPWAEIEISIAAESKFVSTISDLDLPENAAWLDVSSTVPVNGFELFGTWDGRMLSGYSGTKISTYEGFFPKLDTNGWTGIAFVNINRNSNWSSSTVTLTAYDDAGAAIAVSTLALDDMEKRLDLAGNLFDQDISAATYIGFTSERPVVGFQVNGSPDGRMLDAMPVLSTAAPAGRFVDQNLEREIRDRIDKPVEDITAADLEVFINLTIEGLDIDSLDGLQYCVNLTTLRLPESSISDIRPVSALENLQWLMLSDNWIRDIRPLIGLNNLETVDLSRNRISDMDQVRGLTHPDRLYLSENRIRNIDAITDMENWVSIDLSGNRIYSIGPITGLNNCTHLNLSENRIYDIGPISGLNNLTWLDLSGNRILSVGSVTGLNNLYTLDLSLNNIIEMNVFTDVENLRELDLEGNGIRNLTWVSNFENLRRLNLKRNDIILPGPIAETPGPAILDLSHNYINDINPMAGLSGVEHLDLSHNRIFNLTPLVEMSGIENLDLSHNFIGNISPMTGMTNLRTLDLSYNRISDISAVSGLAVHSLRLGYNDITDIGPVAGLTSRDSMSLSLSHNLITDVSPIGQVVPGNFVRLELDGNAITDIEPILGVVGDNLPRLHLDNNPLNAASCIELADQYAQTEGCRQAYYHCSYLGAGPYFRNVSPDGGSTEFTISTGGDEAINWQADPIDPWITIDSGNSGTGSGMITVSYEANTGAPRTGTITLSSGDASNTPQNLQIRQRGARDAGDAVIQQKILFEGFTVNYAWGFQYRGFYVDNEGDWYTYEMPSYSTMSLLPIQPESQEPFTEACLLEKFSHGKTYRGTVDPQTLLEKYQTIGLLKKDQVSESGGICCLDAGVRYSIAYTYDPVTEEYTPVLLHLAGDDARKNLSPHARELWEWLGTLVPGYAYDPLYSSCHP